MRFIGFVCSSMFALPLFAQLDSSSLRAKFGYGFLKMLVPDSIRGKETGRWVFATGAFATVNVSYENVTVTESQSGSDHSRNDTITVSFNDADCRSVIAGIKD